LLSTDAAYAATDVAAAAEIAAGSVAAATGKLGTGSCNKRYVTCECEQLVSPTTLAEWI